MKNLSKITFSFRFAYKNIIRYKFRSMLLMLSFISLLIIVLLGFSIKPLIKMYYYQNISDYYGDIDLYMGTSQNTNTRYFSIRALKDSDDIDEFIDDYIPFFEIQTLIGVKDKKIYVNAMSSSLNQFIKIADEVHITKESLNNDEVIITKSFAENYELSYGDILILFVGDESKSYKIIDIINDGGLFQGNSIFINKEGSISFFLSVLSPNLGGMNPIFYENLYNRVYFNVQEGVDIDVARIKIQQMSPYKNLEFVKTYNFEKINSFINRSLSIFSMIIVFILFAVFLVMQTTFLLVFEQKKKSNGIISLLGGSESFSYFIILIEMFIIFIVSFLISVYLTSLIIKLGLRYIGLSASYHLETSNILFSSLIVIGLFVFTSIYYFLKYKTTSKVQDTVEIGEEFKFKPLKHFVALSVFLVLYIIVVNLSQNNLLIIMQVSIIIIVLFLMSILFIALFKFIIENFKKSVLIALLLKVLLTKKAFYHYLSVLMICLISLFLLIAINNYELKRIDIINNEYQIDFALTNFSSGFNQINDEVKQIELVQCSDPVLMYQDVYFNNYNENIIYFVSIEPDKINHYFNLDLETSYLNKLNEQEHPIILLPERFHYLYKLKIGDQVIVNINPNYHEEVFEIGGFFSKQISDVAFTNMLFVDKYHNETPNTILIKANSNPEELNQILINRFSKNMIYVVDFNNLVQTFTKEIRKIIEYVSYIITVLILCFIISIINHTLILFDQIKKSYARISVLGLSIRKMILFENLKQLIILLSVIFTCVFCMLLARNVLPKLIIVFGEFEMLEVSSSSIYEGIIISSVVYIFANSIYMFKLLTIKPTDVIKTY